MAPQTKRVDLTERVTFNDQRFGPGKDIEVPLDFPEDGDTDPAPVPERVFAKPTSSPPNTGGVNTGESLVPRQIENTTLPVDVPAPRRPEEM